MAAIGDIALNDVEYSEFEGSLDDALELVVSYRRRSSWTSTRPKSDRAGRCWQMFGCGLPSAMVRRSASSSATTGGDASSVRLATDLEAPHRRVELACEVFGRQILRVDAMMKSCNDRSVRDGGDRAEESGSQQQQAHHRNLENRNLPVQGFAPVPCIVFTTLHTKTGECGIRTGRSQFTLSPRSNRAHSPLGAKCLYISVSFVPGQPTT